MSILAIVSKAIFEKQPARKLGELWPTDAYVSTNAGLKALKDGGSLYLVTVRPGDQLWLVAVLETPTFDGKAWKAKANAAPIQDITALVPKLKFTSGKGITAEAGKLGMSLQTPRTLTDDDAVLLEGADKVLPKKAASTKPAAPATAKDAYASAVAKTPKAKAALALGAELAAQVAADPKGRGLMRLRFANHRRYPTWAAASAADKKALEEVGAELEAAEELEGFEVVDVIDDATGRVVYLFALWPFGSGALIDAGTRDEVANVCQHWFNAHEVNPKLRESMAVAYHHAQPLGLKEHVDFTPGKAETEPQAKPATGTLAEQLAAMRVAVAVDKAAGRPPNQENAWKLIPKLIPVGKPKDYHPFPVRRPWELTPLERETLELVVDLGLQAAYFSSQGLPEAPDELARFIGRAPPTLLDEVVVIGGKPHPAWCLVSDAVYDQRPIGEVVELLLGLPPPRLSALWTALLETEAHHLTDPLPRSRAEQAKDSPVYKREVLAKYVEFLVELNLRLGPTGEGRRLAKERAENGGAWITSTTAKLDDWPSLDVGDAFPFVGTLACLARWAKNDGAALDAGYDPLLAVVVRTQMYLTLFPTVVGILETLPAERAQAASGDSIHFVERFPSVAGAERVIRYVENASWVHGPYYERLLVSLFKKVGEPARELLEASLERKHKRRDFMKQLLAKLGKGKKK